MITTLIIKKIIPLLLKLLIYYTSTIPLFAIFAAIQERSIWKHTAQPLTYFGLTKVFVLNCAWMFFLGVGAILLLPLWLSRTITSALENGNGSSSGSSSDVSLEQNAVFEKLTALGLQYTLVCSEVVVHNAENIPPIEYFVNTNANTDDDKNNNIPAPIFIANHCSQIDTCVIYNVVKRFKWIAKQSVKYLPGVGIGMILAKHIFIKRSGKNHKTSKFDLYAQSNKAIQDGVPMVIFPQGTRCIHKQLDFKDGAFKIAIENECCIVPISIYVPVNVWNSYYPFTLLWGGDDDVIDSNGLKKSITITIHKPIQVKKDTNRAELKAKCQDMIYSVLPPSYHGIHDNDNTNVSSNDKKED